MTAKQQELPKMPKRTPQVVIAEKWLELDDAADKARKDADKAKKSVISAMRRKKMIQLQAAKPGGTVIEVRLEKQDRLVKKRIPKP